MLSTITFVSCGNSSNKESQTKEGQKNSTINKKENKMKTINLSKSEFITKVMNYEQNPQEWKYLGDKPCVIDFYADWCRPCHALTPVLEDLATKYKGKLIIYKVNVYKSKNLATFFQIQSIRTNKTKIKLNHLIFGIGIDFNISKIPI